MQRREPLLLDYFKGEGVLLRTTTFTGDLPDDPALLGVTIDLQAIESDSGAVKGVSFTPRPGPLLGH